MSDNKGIIRPIFVGVVTAVLAAVILYYLGIQKDSSFTQEKISITQEKISTPTSELEEKILGIWYCDIQETRPQGTTVNIRGTTEYLRNGTSNSTGEISLRTHTPEGEMVKIIYDFMGSGEWKLYGNKMVDKFVDVKTIPKYLELATGQIDLRRISPAEREQIPKIEDMLPKGTSSESVIIEIGADVMRVQNRDDLGNERIIVYYKRDKPFAENKTVIEETAREANYYKIALRNSCNRNIHVAIHYLTFDKKWVTEGWWLLNPDEKIVTRVMTKNRIIYFYAESHDGELFWHGSMSNGSVSKTIVSNAFTHLDDGPIEGENMRTVSFFRVDISGQYGEYIRGFSCE